MIYIAFILIAITANFAFLSFKRFKLLEEIEKNNNELTKVLLVLKEKTK